MEPADARRVLAYVRLGLGAMWPAPGLGAKLFGLDPDADGSLRMMARLFAIRDLVLGLALLQSDGEDQDRLVDLGMVVDAADLAAIVLAASRKQVGARTLLLGGSAAAGALTLGFMGRRAKL